MTPIGIFTTVVIMLAFVAYRWFALSRMGEFNVRTEWPYWLFGICAIALSVALTIGGRFALLIATPMVLIPAGAYMLKRSDTTRIEFGLDLRRTGWLTIVTGALGGAAAIAALLFSR